MASRGRGLGPTGERVSASLVTGFLGSGKTTLLNALLKDPEMGEAAVIINEFGEIPLDHLLVESSTEDTVLLESGCVCCAVRNDLLDTMNDLWRRRASGELPPFRRIVIETTGLADPAPILKTIIEDPDLSERYWLDSVLVTVDAVNGLATLEQHYESVKQVAVADRLVLTKLDLLTDEERHDAYRTLDDALWDLNASAPHLRLEHGSVPVSELFDTALFHGRSDRPDVDGWLRDDAFEPMDADAHHEDHGHHHDVRSFCLTFGEPIPVAVFEAWVTALVHFKGPNLLRVKGIVHLAELDTPVVLHCVQHAFHPPITLDAWPSDDHRTRIVFITHGIERQAIEAAFAKIAAAAGEG